MYIADKFTLSGAKFNLVPFVGIGISLIIVAIFWQLRLHYGFAFLNLALPLILGSILTITITVCYGIIIQIKLARNKTTAEDALISHPVKIIIADVMGNIQYSNLKNTFYSPKSLYKVFSNISLDLVMEINALQEECHKEKSVTKTFRSDNKDVEVFLYKTSSDLYVWNISNKAPQSNPGPHQYNCPMIEFNDSHDIIHLNLQAKKYFLNNPSNLTDIAPTLGHMKTGKIVLNTSQGEMCFYAQYTGLTGSNNILFLFPSNGMSKSSDFGVSDIFEHIPVALMHLKTDGEIIAINAYGRAVIRDSVSIGQNIKDVFSGTTRSISGWISDVNKSDDLICPEFIHRKNSAEEQVFQANLTQFATNNDDSFLVCNLNDVTELKSLEAQFVQSQKMQAIGQLAGGVAHDFNNLLTAILGHCDLLLLRHGVDDVDHLDLMQIHQNSNRAAALVGQLLAFSRKQKLQFKSLDMRDTLSDLGHLLNRLVGEKITLKLVHGNNLSPVRADKRQLEQVLMNLVINARDAMPDGGNIEVKTQKMNLTVPQLRDRVLIPSGDYVVISVKDQGVGIRSDQLSKIFEPFFTTKKTGQGTGLGLSTVYGIIKQSGGFVFVKSTLGKGTQFDIILNATKVEEYSIVKKDQIVSVPSVKTEGVILLVEDEAPVRAFASRALKLNGYKVLEANCAENALDILSNPNLHIDIFVTDVVMPDMDGPTWVSKARERRPNTPVIFMSGYAEDCLQSNEKIFQDSAFISKPFSLSDLTNIVQKTLN